MSQPLTISLPPDVESSLFNLSASEGIAPEEIVKQAVKQHLFLRRFRTLRERLTAKAATQGVLTDEDVFDRVSGT